MTKIVLVLLLLILILALIVFLKEKLPEKPTEALPITKEEPIEEVKYQSIFDSENQTKGIILENNEEYLLISQSYPKPQSIKIEKKDFYKLKIRKIVPKAEYSKEAMEEIYQELKKVKLLREEELSKENPDVKVVLETKEAIDKLLQEKVFTLVKEEEALYPEFLKDREVTFSRLNKENSVLTVYPPEIKVYFPE